MGAGEKAMVESASEVYGSVKVPGKNPRKYGGICFKGCIERLKSAWK